MAGPVIQATAWKEWILGWLEDERLQLEVRIGPFTDCTKPMVNASPYVAWPDPGDSVATRELLIAGQNASIQQYYFHSKADQMSNFDTLYGARNQTGNIGIGLALI